MRFNLIIAAALLSLGILPAPARDEKPDKKFLQETIAAAENGDPAAQCALGACFESGAGMLKDLDQAAKWYRRAAAQGDAMAECALASCYERGQGVKKDLAEAAKFYTQAAEQGYTRAQLKLGAFYAEGTGVAKDLAQAYKWYQPAAAKGDETACISKNFPRAANRRNPPPPPLFTILWARKIRCLTKPVSIRFLSNLASWTNAGMRGGNQSLFPGNPPFRAGKSRFPSAKFTIFGRRFSVPVRKYLVSLGK